jgi:hypothetical protein
MDGKTYLKEDLEMKAALEIEYRSELEKILNTN